PRALRRRWGAGSGPPDAPRRGTWLETPRHRAGADAAVFARKAAKNGPAGARRARCTPSRLRRSGGLRRRGPAPALPKSSRELYNITTMTLDAADATHWNAVLALAPIDGTDSDEDSPARAWQSLAHGEAGAMEPRMAELFAIASSSRDPRLVVEVTALR